MGFAGRFKRPKSTKLCWLLQVYVKFLNSPANLALALENIKNCHKNYSQYLDIQCYVSFTHLPLRWTFFLEWPWKLKIKVKFTVFIVLFTVFCLIRYTNYHSVVKFWNNSLNVKQFSNGYSILWHKHTNWETITNSYILHCAFWIVCSRDLLETKSLNLCSLFPNLLVRRQV